MMRIIVHGSGFTGPESGGNGIYEYLNQMKIPRGEWERIGPADCPVLIKSG